MLEFESRFSVLAPALMVKIERFDNNRLSSLIDLSGN